MTKSIRFNNSDLYYRVAGSGKPVVLIHGLGEDGTIWDSTMETLKGSFQVVVPDLPGSGLSPMINKKESMESLADAVIAIMQAESIITAAVIGHSMGGYVTMAIADKYPDYIKALGLFHSIASPDSEEKKEARRKSIEFIKEHGAAKFIEQATPGLFSEGYKSQHPEIVEEITARYTNFSAHALVQYYEAMMQRPDRTSVLKTFKGPVLFIMGKHDKAVPIELSLQQSHLPQLSYIKILENSGHMGMIEEPAIALPFLQKFLNEIEIVNPY